MSKVLHCGDVMEGCAQVLRGTTEDEVMQQAGVHAARDRTCRWSGGISPMRSTGCWNVLTVPSTRRSASSPTRRMSYAHHSPSSTHCWRRASCIDIPTLHPCDQPWGDCSTSANSRDTCWTGIALDAGQKRGRP